MNAWWQHFRNEFTPEECAALVDYALALPAVDGKIGHGADQKKHAMRQSTVRWLVRSDPEVRFVFDRIVLRALQVNHRAFALELSDYPMLRCGAAQFTEYQAEQGGHYNWHEDNAWITAQPRTHDRKLSCVVQLSAPSSYAGGRLELERDNLTGDIFTMQGDMIFFPSHLRHRVTPVTEGTRHSLVLWFEGPPLK